MTRLLLILLVCFTTPSFAQSAFKKVLFLGNSITKHGPKADIDWSGNWGMAASAEAKDYVHVFTKALSEKQGSTPEILVKNIADFERAGDVRSACLERSNLAGVYIEGGMPEAAVRLCRDNLVACERARLGNARNLAHEPKSTSHKAGACVGSAACERR